MSPAGLRDGTGSRGTTVRQPWATTAAGCPRPGAPAPASRPPAAHGRRPGPRATTGAPGTRPGGSARPRCTSCRARAGLRKGRYRETHPGHRPDGRRELRSDGRPRLWSGGRRGLRPGGRPRLWPGACRRPPPGVRRRPRPGVGSGSCSRCAFRSRVPPARGPPLSLTRQENSARSPRRSFRVPSGPLPDPPGCLPEALGAPPARFSIVFRSLSVSLNGVDHSFSAAGAVERLS